MIQTPMILKHKEKEVARSSQAKNPKIMPVSKAMFKADDKKVVLNVDTLPHELRLTFMYAKKNERR